MWVDTAVVSLNTKFLDFQWWKSQYVEYVADNILKDIGENTIYDVSNPFGFMGQFGIERKVDNFHRKNTGYIAYESAANYVPYDEYIN